MSSGRELLLRYLEQRAEFGERELILTPEAVANLRRGAAPPGGVTVDTAKASPRLAEPPVRDPVAATPRLVPMGSLDALRSIAHACTACGLAATRNTVVFGEGNPNASLMVVGEAPGADEDRQGRPFVGRAGKLLDLLLQSVGFPRDEVYICNVLKCRPPENRNPHPEEVRTCSPFLRGQIEAVKPRAILAVGTFPAQTLLDTQESIGRLRGGVQDYHGVPLIPTYHPAALLRNPTWIRPVWEDLQRLRAVLDGR
jgi:uracil-DNA glycosylase family 4